MASARKPANAGWFMRFLALPWIDPICLWAMGVLLPASRLWAAAAKARGDRREIAELAGVSRVSEGLAMRMARTEGLYMDSEAARARWEAAVFGGDGDVAMLERARRRAAQAFLGYRLAYLIEAAFRRTPAARFSIPPWKSAFAELKPALADPGRYFKPPSPLPAIERGRSIDLGDVVEYWLRFPGSTDGIADRVIVHVYEPKGGFAGELPNLVFCHGLAMELEMLAEPPEGFIRLARSGMRVVLPDAPGHNRRCQHGFYGGETFIRAAPVSAIRHFREAASDFAAIISWLRTQGGGKVALGGISLGALSAQVAACHWDNWPPEARADALLLVTTTDDVSMLPLRSSLARVAGLDKLLRQAGWNEEEVSKLAALADANAEPPIDPSNIVLVLGKRDDLTPISGGMRLAEKWRIPPENLYLRNQGHFSAAVGLHADPAPFARILEILNG